MKIMKIMFIYVLIMVGIGWIICSEKSPLDSNQVKCIEKFGDNLSKNIIIFRSNIFEKRPSDLAISYAIENDCSARGAALRKMIYDKENKRMSEIVDKYGYDYAK